MHPEITIAMAHQHAAELHQAAARHRRHRAGTRRRPHRPSLRTRTGWLLVRWGHRLAPPPRIAPGSSRAATMGA